jgi:hypothetical protein
MLVVLPTCRNLISEECLPSSTLNINSPAISMHFRVLFQHSGNLLNGKTKWIEFAIILNAALIIFHSDFDR